MLLPCCKNQRFTVFQKVPSTEIDYLSSILPCNTLLFLDSTSAHNKDLNNYTL